MSHKPFCTQEYIPSTNCYKYLWRIFLVVLFSIYTSCEGLLCNRPITTRIIIHLFPWYSRGIYRRDTEGSIYQRLCCVHRENPVTRKAHKNKKALITLLDWMNGPLQQPGELQHHSLWVPISQSEKNTGHRVQFLLCALLVFKNAPEVEAAAGRATFQCTASTSV